VTALPLEASGRRPAFFDQDGMDQLVSMVLELAAELWVVRERSFIMERVLARHGLAVSEAIEAYTPTADEQATLAQMRAKMTAQMFRTLAREHRAVGQK
jgi:hypothetical protein